MPVLRSSAAAHVQHSGVCMQAKAAKDKAETDAALVKTVMGTSGGDNAALAKKIHDRYERCTPILLPLLYLLCTA